VTVAQELLARGARVDRVAFLNGGLYPDLHRPTDVQQALLSPGGAELAAALTPELLAPGLRTVLARRVPDAVLADLAAAAARRDGLRQAHLLMGYVAERRQHGQRWVAALEASALPLAFVWGQRDPVSGAHMRGTRGGRAGARAVPQRRSPRTGLTVAHRVKRSRFGVGTSARQQVQANAKRRLRDRFATQE